MSEKFLDCPQIRPSAEQMSGEGMSERVRCRMLRQAGELAIGPQGLLSHCGVQLRAASTHEQGCVRHRSVAEPQVSRNRFAYCRKNWHQAGFSAFAKDPKRLRSAWERGVAHRKRQGLAES